MISRTMFAISMEESRFTLNGALLLLKTDSTTMVATDGHRLAYVEIASPAAGMGKSFRALVPRKAMAEIVKLADESGADSQIDLRGGRKSSVLPIWRAAC